MQPCLFFLSMISALSPLCILILLTFLKQCQLVPLEQAGNIVITSGIRIVNSHFVMSGPRAVGAALAAFAMVSEMRIESFIFISCNQILQ